MYRKLNVRKLNALWEARGVWDSHVVVRHDWKSENDRKNQGGERPQIFQTENQYLSSHHMAPVSCGHSLPQTEEECGIQDSLCEANN